MPKPLPPATVDALNPPPSAAFPYTFFSDVEHHPFQPNDAAPNLRNAWWLMDAAFLAYCSEPDIRRTLQGVDRAADIKYFASPLNTQCYVVASNDWIVLAFRGTQVDDFWSSVMDWAVDARFAPVPDRNFNLVHAGFLRATVDVWKNVQPHVLALQKTRRRPFWITGHSLGAALATVAANLSADEPGLGLTGLYTYGSPRVGDAGFGRTIAVPAYRFRNNADIVTNVPLGLVFRHVGALELIDGGGHLHSNLTLAAEILVEAGSARVSAVEAHALSNLLRTAAPGFPLPGFLADHAPVNYSIRIWNCYEASRRSTDST
jgi:triacylglycerol lipase